MRSKNLFIGVLVLLLIVGTGSFVFAGKSNEELDVDNRPQNSDSTNNFTKTDNKTNIDSEKQTDTEDISTIPSTDISNPTEINNSNSSTNNTNNRFNKPSQGSNKGSSTSNINNISTPSNSETSNNGSTNNSGNTQTSDENKPVTPSNPVEPTNPTNPDSSESTDNNKSTILKIEKIITSNNNGQKRTFEPITVTIIFNEEISKVDGDWQVDGNTITKDNITSNGTIRVYDRENKYFDAEYTISNYYPNLPIINISTSSDGKSELIMTYNENTNVDTEGWTCNEERICTKPIDSNENGTIIIKVNDIETEIPFTKASELKVTSDNQNPDGTYNYTNKAIVTISLVEDLNAPEKYLEPLEGWTLSEDKLTIYKEFYSFEQDEVTVTDSEGNKATVTYLVKNVNSSVPTLKSLTGSKVSEGIKIEIITKSLKYAPEGWNISNIQMTMFNKIVTENKWIPVSLCDIWGNEAKYYVKATIDENGNATAREANLAEMAAIIAQELAQKNQ